MIYIYILKFKIFLFKPTAVLNSAVIKRKIIYYVAYLCNIKYIVIN